MSFSKTIALIFLILSFTSCARNIRYGFVDIAGELVISPDIDDLWDFKEDVAVIKVRSDFGYLVLENDKVKRISPRFEGAASFSEGLAPVIQNRKTGYINRNGDMVIQVEFDEAYGFSEGLARVKINDRFGFIDKNGRFAVPAVFAVASDFSEGFSAVGFYLVEPRREFVFGYIDKSGVVVIPLYNIASVGSNYASLFKSRADKTAGDHKILPRFLDLDKQKAPDFSADDVLELIKVVMRDINRVSGWGDSKSSRNLTRTETETIAVMLNRIAKNSPDEEIRALAVWATGLFRFPNFDKTLYSAVRDDSRMVSEVAVYELSRRFRVRGYDFSEGRALFRIGERYGYIDTTGNIVISPVFSDGSEFRNGFAVVKYGDKYSYIDKDGGFLVEPRFELAYPFNDNVALIVKDEKYGFIRDNGTFLFEPVFQKAYYFSEGIAPVKWNFRWGFVSIDGTNVVSPRFEDVSYFSGGLCAVKENGKWGYIGTNGQFIIPPKFDNALPFSNGVAPVLLKRKWGYINSNGDFVIEPRFVRAFPFINGVAPVKQRR
jgi:hypothetical protein